MPSGVQRAGMPSLLRSPLPPNLSGLFLGLLCVLLLPAPCRSQSPPASDTSEKTDSAAPQAQPQASSNSNNTSELSSHDTPATFKVRVNLVLVRVVVRDAEGHVVPNLKKEDFQLFDNRKPQTIS